MKIAGLVSNQVNKDEHLPIKDIENPQLSGKLKPLSDILAPEWEQRLADEFAKEYMDNLRNFLRQEYSTRQVVFPPKEKIFRALKIVDYSEVKVVILGQDPYHGNNQANGLAFAVNEKIKIPPSLLNIFKEIADDTKNGFPSSTTLENWAYQGVLLLNTVLTVRANEAFSHRNRGWEKFTERVIQELNNHPSPLVFLLWGSAAHEKQKIITNPKHLILKTVHPSPLSAYRGFMQCKHFSKTNDFLIKMGITPIDWQK